MSNDELQRLKAKNSSLEKENKQLREKIKELSAELFVKLQTGYQVSKSPDETTTLHMDL
jgi:cell division protein FtsB